jgi:hypothetical protein
MKQKNIFLSFIVLIITGMLSGAYAKTIEVMSLSDFSTAKPPASITVELLDNVDLDENTTLSAGTAVQGKLIDVVSPKRLKKDATFSFEPTSYKDANGETKVLHTNTIAKYSKTLDKGQLAKSAALGVGGFFVKGLSTGVAAVEGAVKNEEGNVIKSTAVSVYEASPISYVEKGKDLVIKTNQIFYLKFPKVKDEDEE